MPTPKPYVARNKAVTWKVRFRVYGEETSETFDDEKEAWEFCRLIEQVGTAAARAWRVAKLQEDKGVTLDEVAEQFFTWKRTRVRSDRTIADYRRDYNNWIQPELGHRIADGITESDVQLLVDSMDDRLSAKSICDRHAILHAIFKWAISPTRRIVDNDPCTATELPKKAKRAPKGLRPAEWQALFAALRQVDRNAADLAAFLLGTGWRWSEAVALRAYDVDDDGNTVHVNMGRVLRRMADGTHQFVEGEGKSAAALRRVKLDPDTAAVVRARRDLVDGDGLIFTTKTGERWHYSNFRRRKWDRAVDAAGLTRGPTPHWLRHTHVAWLVLAGASLPEIQRRIGHEHISTTIDVYGRWIEDVSDSALTAFATFRDQDPKVLQQPGQLPQAELDVAAAGAIEGDAAVIVDGDGASAG